MKIKSSEVRDTILEKSKQILETGEFNSLTMRSVASECDIALGTIYRYFKNKDEILVELSKEYWHDALESLNEITYSGTDFDTNLKIFYSHLFPLFTRFENDYILRLRDMSVELKDTGRSMEKRMFDLFVESIYDILVRDTRISLPDNLELHELSKLIRNSLMYSILQKNDNIDQDIHTLKSLIIQ
ncbi:TetR/AcrR family transcriptional regulator [Erysipelothrix inopinata]|uniref:TetR/AcrR family transcriptional regulator n=1 Tax=Erysipelothrix inopinata TaxID=225084 RepID=A0A7G9S0S9_9FIRM|nr:TetR/AcrR family transcriptional regulator [Erysipelothrix inopinata]QNN61454.1 TetR/AcrR family transcriptional regulator [Erysipelothrix inopinata]